MDREKTRNFVLTKAMDMFVTRGYAAVRMDDVARELSVSKRTIYEMFQTKECLFVECVKTQIGKTEQRIRQQMESGMDVITVTLLYMYDSINATKNVNKAFFDDLLRFPELSTLYRQLMDSFEDNMVRILMKGVSQGVFREDVNMEIVAMVQNSIRNLWKYSRSDRRYTFEQIFQSVIMVQLRGLSTAKGLELLDNFKYKYTDKDEQGKNDFRS